MSPHRTFKYALCFVPCLVPFITQEYYVGKSVFLSYVTPLKDLGTYVLTYFFDPTLGFFAFATMEIMLFFALAIIAICKKKYQAITWLLFLLGVVTAFSLMQHINCGMLYCARYLIWSYPIICIFLATIGYEAICLPALRTILYAAAAVSTGLLLYVNQAAGYQPYEFNSVTRLILEKAPLLYNPYYATFYCRTLHEDGAYNHTEPAYYLSPQTDEVRKLIFKSEKGADEQILYDLTGDDASVAYLTDQLEQIPEDGEYHYLNFSESSPYQLHRKTLEEQGLLKDGTVLIDQTNFHLQGNGNSESSSFPIAIQANTTYRIELTLPADTDFTAAKSMLVDFCGTNYDNAEQEISYFTVKGKTSYRFYFDSGTFGSETNDVQVRLFAWTGRTEGEGLSIAELKVIEMISQG